MRSIRYECTPRTARSLIRDSSVIATEGSMKGSENGDGNPMAVIFLENPRFNASDLLQRSRNGRIIFAGDSIVRNQWESMLCMLSQGVSNLSNIYEENGSPITKHKGFLSFRFQEYNLTVEYYRVPFLVRISRPPPNSPPQVRGAIRIDKLHWFSNKWSGADILIFSGGHWWTEDKTTKAGAYFQEGQELNMTMDYKEAFYRTLKTLKAWAMQNLDPLRAHIFLRSYSSIHFRNGTWDQGGTCKDNNQPETDSSNFPTETPFDQFIYGITKEMEVADRKAKYLNITYLTEFRSDGHPSTHREEGTIQSAIEDCSHWCLPGVPDTWNEILYAHLLIENFITEVKNDM
ncbi:hypothetical protein Droror1_Dr00026368 [Drosera rotundifolia]